MSEAGIPSGGGGGGSVLRLLILLVLLALLGAVLWLGLGVKAALEEQARIGRETLAGLKGGAEATVSFQLNQENGGLQRVLSLINQGPGPARVRQVLINVDGAPLGSGAAEDWRQLLTLIQREGVTSTASVLGDGRIIPAGGRQRLYSIRIDDPEQRTEIDAVLDRIRFGLCYCSVYGQCKTTGTIPARADRGYAALHAACRVETEPGDADGAS